MTAWLESLVPRPLRGLTAARIRRALWSPPRRALVRWRHRRDGGTRAFANAVPKAGTHLLKRSLDLSGRFEGLDVGVSVYGLEGRRGLRARASRLRRLGGGTYVLAHLPHAPEAERLLEELGYRHVLIVRDPRDIAVSRFRFEATYPHLPYHELFAGLADDDARLRTSIEGNADAGFLDIGSRMRSYLAWGERACCVVRFESLVGPCGGGERVEQIDELDRLFRHLDVTLDEDALGRIADGLYSSESRTFRRGAIGDWRRHFTPSHRALFKQVAGDVLIEMGYERDGAW